MREISRAQDNKLADNNNLDASCEGIIMRAAQPFSMRYPLVEVEGSYGNPMESGNWAASRYTSSRLAKLSSYLFTDIEKDTIEDWRDNYDDTEQYPSVLPSKGFYNLVNGTQGIAVGAASSIPSFNLKELNAALITLLKNPNASFEEIYCAPDFPTGGTIINEEAIKESLKVGNGKACMIRATFVYDKTKNTLTVTEIPYNVYTNTICQELEAIVNGPDNPGIDRFNDLTGEQPCIRLYLEKGVKPEFIENYLYKNTSLQSSYGINMTMLDQGRFPKVFSWKEALKAHLAHERIVYIRGYEYDLKKLNHRKKIIEGIIKAIAKIEEVIATIKSSISTQEANGKLQVLLNIDEEQAKAILDIKLARLAHLEIEKFENELKAIGIEIERIEKILNSEELLIQEMIKTYEEVAKRFGDDRRTKLMNITITKEEKEIANVEPEKCVVIMTESGLIKRVPSSSFRTQRRNGKGVKSADDVISCVIRTNTIDSLMVFSTQGQMYRLLVNDIPVGTNTSQGISIKTLVTMNANEEASTIYSIYRDTEAKYVFFTTKSGIVKKTSLDEYIKTKKKSGIAAINLREGDEIASVSLVDKENILLITEQGMCIKFDSMAVGATSRTTVGIKGINLNEGDKVVCALPIRDEKDSLAIFTKAGLGKKVGLTEFPLQGRGGKGLVCYKPSGETGTVAGAALISDEDDLLVAGSPSSICVSAKDVPLMGRGAIGNQIIKGSRISSVSKI